MHAAARRPCYTHSVWEGRLAFRVWEDLGSRIPTCNQADHIAAALSCNLSACTFAAGLVSGYQQATKHSGFLHCSIASAASQCNAFCLCAIHSVKWSCHTLHGARDVCCAALADGGREGVGRAGQIQAGHWAGSFHPGSVEVEGTVWRVHQSADAQPWRLLRLESRAFHPGHSALRYDFLISWLWHLPTF